MTGPNRGCSLEKGATLNRRAAIARITSASLAVPMATAAIEPSEAASPLESVTVRLGRRTTGASTYKETAHWDYLSNMSPFGGRLSSAPDAMWTSTHRGVPWQFDVLIIGSGYGASVTAARLAQRLRPGARLAIVERGREWIPGSFPDTVSNMIDASRHRLFVQKDEIRNPLGLFNVRQFKEISVLSGTGLGGSSLINASVAYRADAEVFRQSVWPGPLRDRLFLDPYYDLAEWELGVVREPIDWTDKMKAQRLAAENLRDVGAHFEAAALTLTRTIPRAGADSYSMQLPIVNRQGLRQRACIDCGDCLTGCNVGAKNTLAMNYLPLARRAGAEIYTQTEIHHIEKCQGFYRLVAAYHPADAMSPRDCAPVVLTARIVVLAAGSLGSTEILLRSAAPNLQLSGMLGTRWTGNGDALGFIRRSQSRTGIAGFGAYEDESMPVGPTIESNITYPMRPLQYRVLIQEGAATRAYANALSVLMRDLDLENTQVLLGMGHDGAQGRITLEGDQARLDWPGLTESPYRQLIRDEFRQIAEAQGGQYKFLRIFGDKMISVHPLGGCSMGEAANCGVVNHKGQVFDARGGGDIDPRTGQMTVHCGLYVCDGSILPTSIACNPLLTISAMAERATEMISLEPEYQDIFDHSKR